VEAKIPNKMFTVLFSNNFLKMLPFLNNALEYISLKLFLKKYSWWNSKEANTKKKIMTPNVPKSNRRNTSNSEKATNILAKA
jgi:hypothetical protein